MTREEAIKILKAIRVYECYPKSASEETKEAINMAIEALSAEAGWIPCSERLPDVGRDVLFSVADMYVAEGCIRADGDWTQFRWSAIRSKEEVVAWKPLPKPYKGGDDE